MKEAIIISGILAFFIKIAIHVWLNVKNKRFEGLKPFNMMPFLCFFPYMEEVKARYHVNSDDLTHHSGHVDPPAKQAINERAK